MTLSILQSIVMLSVGYALCHIPYTLIIIMLSVVAPIGYPNLRAKLV
jgi:hypothetical protein